MENWLRCRGNSFGHRWSLETGINLSDYSQARSDLENFVDWHQMRLNGMITTQLRELEADGVITRHVYTEIPPRVDYEVTKYGKSLHSIILAMQVWGSDFKTRKFAEEGNESLTEGKVHRKKVRSTKVFTKGKKRPSR